MLVIDDSDISRESMLRQLADAGFEAVGLPSPIGATVAVIRHEVRLVVIDIHMPTMRGDALAKLFRKNPRLDGLKLILTSGTAPECLDVLADEVSADGIVAKAERGKLVSEVRRLIGTPRE